MKKALKVAGSILLAFICVIAVYITYCFATYYRLDDNIEIPIEKTEQQLILDPSTDTDLSIVDANYGYGTFSPDYTFFMDGGSESWARSLEECNTNITVFNNEIMGLHPDFALMQELDIDADRSYHQNQYDLVRRLNPEYNAAFAQNYDSPYLFYPFHQPIGKTKAGMATLSRYSMSSAIRRSLPMPTDFNKFLDLDRCLEVTRIPTTTGHDLVLINLHLSAYGKESDTSALQDEMLFTIMQEERDKGNYVIAGGDFNHDMNYDAAENNAPDYAEPFVYSRVPKGFTVTAAHFSSDDASAYTNRDGGSVVDENNRYRVFDSFIFSDNIECLSSEVVNLGFKNSDHNPLLMHFSLKE